jgi:hypothetical protein
LHEAELRKKLSSMTPPRGRLAVASLLSFNGGFVDTVGFLGLSGLFVAHVTGNFVTLGAALVLGSHGILNKVLALPEFIAVIALARLAGGALRPRGMPVLRIMLSAEVVLLTAFFVLAVAFGPFEDADRPLALLTGFAGIAAMALQNALQRVHLASLPSLAKKKSWVPACAGTNGQAHSCRELLSSSCKCLEWALRDRLPACAVFFLTPETRVVKILFL